MMLGLAVFALLCTTKKNKKKNWPFCSFEIRHAHQYLAAEEMSKCRVWSSVHPPAAQHQLLDGNNLLTRPAEPLNGRGCGG